MIKWRYCPELVQFHGFRSVEVLLDTPPRCSKSCPEAKGGSVRVQISPSRPVSVYMVKQVLSKSRSVQSSPVKSSLGFWQSLLRSTSCLSAKNTLANAEFLDDIAKLWIVSINHILADSICATHNARHIGVALGKDDQIAWCWTLGPPE
ncbi:hypothetical protein F2Q68_00038697 [Brassica cretica]|uniref:Uncharacterized protein n=2 Tax=Brassica cretica TaxID=69181 RepID=A0A8S9MJN2_BRACR|nr:hypothetical protein F2Q68_00038697 [Brassica cretica]